MFDMNFRVDWKLEQDFNSQVPFIKSVINTWADRKKTFRMLNRVRFTHPEFPVFADVSIIRSSKKYGKPMVVPNEFDGGRLDGGAFKHSGTNVPIPKYTIQEAGVFDNAETYEVELEIDNARVGNGTAYDTPEKLMDALRKCIRIILCGIQRCNYPISFTERDIILNSYMKTLLNGNNKNSNKDDGKDDDNDANEYQYKKININNKREFFSSFSFIGPGSITLQREHILPKKEGSS
jgi:hypothetical protein